MKAILCMDNNVFEIENWFNFEDSKKFMLESLPKRCTMIVDDKLFTSMKKLGLTQDFNMIVFGSNKNFVGAVTCKDFASLEKELEKTTHAFLVNGCSVFDELLPFCSALTVAKFNRTLPKGHVASEPKGSDRWFCTTTTNRKNAQILNYVNVMPFPLSVMNIKQQLEDEDKKSNIQKRDKAVAAKTFVLKDTKEKKESSKGVEQKEAKTNSTKIPANSEDIMKRVVRKKTSSIKTENKNASKKTSLEEFAKTK